MDSVENVKAYLYGVVCTMNRYYTTPISQALYEIYTSVHYSNMSRKQLFELVCDMMELAGDTKHTSYKKILYYVQQRLIIDVTE